MTIKYLAGHRIEGLAADTKPTTAEDGSIFTETDTGNSFKIASGTWSAFGPAMGGSSVVEPHSYYIYRTGSTYFAQAGDNITPALTSNSDFVTLISGVINGVTAGTPLKIQIGAGDFLIQSAWSIPQTRIGNIVIEGQGMGVTRLLVASGLNGASAGTAAITFGSDLTIAAGNTGTLTANCLKRTRTATMSTPDGAKFAQNDFVLLKSNKLWTTPATASSLAKQGEIKQIFQAPASGVVTFDLPTFDTYNTANTAVIYKLSMIKNIKFANLTITNDVSLTSSVINFINFKYCVNLRVQNVEIIDNKNVYESGITLFSCIDAVVTGCNLVQNNTNTLNFQYGIVLNACCQNCIISDCTSRGRFRHSYEMCNGQGDVLIDIWAGICRNTTITNCVSIGNEIAAFDTHPDGELTTFQNCKSLGNYSEFGFQIKSKKTKVMNCSAHSASTLGYLFYEDAHDCQLIGSDALNCGWYGVSVGSPDDPTYPATNMQIIGGSFSGGADFGIYVTRASSYLMITGTICKDNAIGGMKIEGTSNFTITDCIIANNTNYGIYIDPAGGTTPANFIITGNHFEGQSSAPLTLVAPISELTNYVRDNMGRTTVGLPIRTAYQAVSTTPVTLSATTDQLVKVDATGGARTVNLPTASTNAGLYFTVIKSDSSANTVTIDGAGSETINGALTLVLTSQYQSFTLRCDGTNWLTVPNTSERTGTATGTANGSTTVFNIAHGLGSTPYSALIACSSHSNSFTYTTTTTNIVVTFGTAPSSSPATAVFHWRAVL